VGVVWAGSLDVVDALGRLPSGVMLEPDLRVIDPEAPQYNATLVQRVDLTEDLGYFWVRFDGPPTHFDPGQYMTTGLFADGKLWQRPYSTAMSSTSASCRS
jgi:hypothetical protein